MILRRNCQPPRRMMGGIRAPAESAPWMALLHLLDDLSSCRCGGTLITSNFILTAAHCIKLCPRNQELRVCLGTKNVTSPNDCLENYGIERIIMHEEFNLYEQVNDIALLKLNGSVRKLGYIRPVCLPILPASLQKFPDLGANYHSFGWGVTEDGNQSTELIQIQVQSSECPYSSNGMFFCTTSHKVDSCQGDSGGPMIAQRLQFGIIAHGRIECGSAGGAFNTNVSYFMPWIVERLAEHL
ncbi:serine protease grass-like [Drosophila ficusphila]|uniref:serine protease grass-like n=1 Tax=Drosophila ficusphila TaxID=30025 RepID=UPI0007E81AEF|nr:serine protease grass-like [Drosophila ficusphila]